MGRIILYIMENKKHVPNHQPEYIWYNDSRGYNDMANQPDTLQKMTNSWLVNVDNPIDTQQDQLRLVSTHLRLI